MPAHKHGSVRQTKTTALGDGRYRVSGFLLHMEGHWQLFVDIGFERQFDRATFDVLLAPEEADGSYAEFSVDEVSRVLALSPLPEPPDDPTNAYDLDQRAARLGQFLFFDARLSGSGKTSCATCHVPARNWSDGRALAVAEQQLPRRTMPLWNVAYQRWWFWDGRADSLWSQALQPLEDPREMAGSRVAIARLLHDDADLRRAYAAVFGEPPDVADASRFPTTAKPVAADPECAPARAWSTMADADRAAIDRVFANVGKAIAAFQRQIVSRTSAFDDFVEGLRQGDAERMAAFGPAARRGLKLFLGRANCHFCHSGPNFTDREFHNNRAPRRPELPIDLGRFTGVVRLRTDPFNALGEHADGHDPEARAKLEHLPVDGSVWGEFRTPTLRGVAAGGPYMHQGQFETLAQVVDFYSDQVSGFTSHGDYDPVLQPVRLSAEEKDDLIEFLRSLSGAPLPEPLLRQPDSPCLE
jgi:cytochrome c peroxidase